ncbi:hypothetical protein KDW54_25580 [Burkholderia ambifaria]|uniref:hypothetical protein n=1 Tax=Burkholderia ambifaria TaxID=152480 RepID=UPI001B9FFD78|nr:hypothetical protein [Burkholderia ambifaria]MBR8185763.1 hypothetical protein [Burkholderia ambifaria]
MEEKLDTQYGLLSVVNEPKYSFESKDNARSYPLEIRLAHDSITSIHGVALNGHDVVVVGATGGCSTVHDRSALVIDGKLYLAVGDQVACLSLELPYRLIWSTRVDTATCFGVYWDSKRATLISHGELEIARLSLHGDLLWQASGADIFTEGFRLLPDYIEAIDFNQTTYRFDYETGDAVLR